MTKTVWTNFRSQIPRRLHMKFGFNRPSGFWGEDVWKCWHTTHIHPYGRQRPAYPISSPLNLRLRWAKFLNMQRNRRRFLKVFTIYGNGGHFGHLTWIVWTNFRSPIPWRLHMKKVALCSENKPEPQGPQRLTWVNSFKSLIQLFSHSVAIATNQNKEFAQTFYDQ